MQIDLEIGLSLVVVCAVVFGMVYAARYVLKHIQDDERRADI